MKNEHKIRDSKGDADGARGTWQRPRLRRVDAAAAQTNSNFNADADIQDS